MFKYLVHGSFRTAAFDASSPAKNDIKSIRGMNAAPAILNQNEEVRFVFNNSAWVEIIKLISYQRLCQ